MDVNGRYGHVNRRALACLGTDGQRTAVQFDDLVGDCQTDTAAALGFISAIGAIGGFFIPKAFGTSLAMTGSPVGAMKVFFVFYVVCVLVTWLVYGRRKPAQP